MLDLIAKHARFIESFHVLLYEREGDSFRFRAEVTFKNKSKVFIKEYVFENLERKYAYHWTDASENLICRWDNSNHWPDISTFPHHKHIGSEIFESTQTNFGDVLDSIIKEIEDNTG